MMTRKEVDRREAEYVELDACDVCGDPVIHELAHFPEHCNYIVHSGCCWECHPEINP